MTETKEITETIANKYTNGKIYRMQLPGDEKFYVGSTTNTLKTRLCNHLKGAGRCKSTVYRHLDGQWDKVEITLLESYPCKTKYELLAREQYWCDKLQPQLNSKQAYATTPALPQRECKVHIPHDKYAEQ